MNPETKKTDGDHGGSTASSEPKSHSGGDTVDGGSTASSEPKSHSGGDTVELLLLLRDVYRAELAHNPLQPAGPAKAKLLAKLDEMFPPTPPPAAETPRRTR